MTDPVISVVMPVLNGAATIGQQLRSLLSQQCDAEFEVVDEEKKK